MIAVIRICGNVNIKAGTRETLNRLNLRKKYSCVVLRPVKDRLGMIKRVKDFVAFGEIKKDVFEKLVKERGQLIDKTKKVEAKKAVEEFEKGKRFEELGLKPFFRLHPPRGGIDSKKHFGVAKGILGNNKEHINQLIERML